MIGVPEAQDPSADHFLSVGRSDVVEIGKGTEKKRERDRLVGRSVLADTDGVVSGNGDESKLHQSGHSERRSGVKPEDEVTRHDAVGTKSAIAVVLFGRGLDHSRDDGTLVPSGETVGGSHHGMLSDTVSDLSTRIIAIARLGVLELDHSVPVDKRRLAQIGTSDQK